MTTAAIDSASLDATAPPAAHAVLRLLRSLRRGTLDVRLPNGSMLRFGESAQAQASGEPGEPGEPGDRLHASISLRNWNACGATLRHGDIGFAESYIAGDWTTPDLPSLLELFISNRNEVESLVYGSVWGSLLHRVRHWLNRNSRRGSRKNIHAHYDLGNEFYRLWLDPTMNYSSAWFEGDRDGRRNGDLAEAQQAKVRRALAECGIRPGERLLEIGCGWGALAESAARTGVQVTGVTLSSEQLAWARQRLDGAQLPADLRLQDYRDVDDEPFDAIVSIEMFEAVGREYWPGYFEALRRNLKPGGRACIQSITIRDDLFARYLKSSDFIQQYIFPGGLLPSPSAFREAAQRGGLRVVNELAFGLDYAQTLQRWRASFLANEGPIRKLGFDTRFMRIWEFYLAYCEAAFKTGNTDVVQFTLQRD